MSIGRAIQHYPLARTIPESRSKACNNIVYPPDLPKAAVIVCFRNESVLMLVRYAQGSREAGAVRTGDQRWPPRRLPALPPRTRVGLRQGRTVHTILERSEEDLLAQIVLVDDNAEAEGFYPLDPSIDPSRQTEQQRELHGVRVSAGERTRCVRRAGHMLTRALRRTCACL